MRIIFFKGIYDTLDLFTEELDHAFRELGCSTFTVHTDSQKTDLRVLKELLKEESAAVVTFNNLGYNLEVTKGKNIWEEYNVPYVNILMDHPFHYEYALEHAPETTVALCIDRNHVSYIRRFFPNIKKSGFLPHAGCSFFLEKLQEETEQIHTAQVHTVQEHVTQEHVTQEHVAQRHVVERPIGVLYAGSLSKYKIERLIPDFGEFHDFDAAEMSGMVLEELTRHPEKTTEQAVEEYLEAIGFSAGKNLTERELGHIITRMRFLDGYAVSFFREQSVRILADSGIPVTVYGDGWEQTDWTPHPHLHIGGKVLAPEILSLMQQSKIVLNTMTWFKDGTHDRVFNGMLAGAAVVTDPSFYMEEQFKDHEELEFFRLNELRALPEKVSRLLKDDEKREKMAQAGQKKAAESHTWKNRAEPILTFLRD